MLFTHNGQDPSLKLKQKYHINEVKYKEIPHSNGGSQSFVVYVYVLCQCYFKSNCRLVCSLLAINVTRLQFGVYLLMGTCTVHTVHLYRVPGSVHVTKKKVN